jgi:electron transport complex protein RnfD
VSTNSQPLSRNLLVSASPHITSGESIPRIMYNVILAMVPACLVSIYYFGYYGIKVLVLTTLFCVGFEYLWQKLLKKPVTISDGSAAVTGILLALNLPPSAPWWLMLVGSFLAIVIAKQLYGGLGYNLFNPAMVARVALLISFPVQMTNWIQATPLFSGVDAVTTATPLGILQTAIKTTGSIPPEVMEQVNPSTQNMLTWFTGHLMTGSLGEISALAILLGGLWLIIKRYIYWHVPVAYIGTVLLFSGIFWIIDPARYAHPLFHLLTGGLFLGAFFMATDMVTSPVTRRGMLVFGIGCGLITCLIRMWGSYPEGVSFAILLMNALTPLLDRWFKPTVFGKRKLYEEAK